MLWYWLFSIISRFFHINGSHMKVADVSREKFSGTCIISSFMTMDHVSDPKVINMRLCKGSREIFRISSICLTSCYLSLLATQHACAWDLISLIPNSAADSIRFSSNYSCQQQVLIIFTKPSYLHLFCRSIYYSRNERNILFIWKPRSLGTDLRDIPVRC